MNTFEFFNLIETDAEKAAREAAADLAFQQESFFRAYAFETAEENVSASAEYVEVEQLRGFDHFGVAIWERRIRTTPSAAWSDFATLFCGGTRVRVSKIRRYFPGHYSGEIVASKEIDVPAWK